MGGGELEVPEVDAGLPEFVFPLDLLPELDPDLFLSSVLSGLWSDLSEASVLLLPERDFSRERSHWRESIVCARVLMSSRVAGLPCWPITSLMRSARPE